MIAGAGALLVVVMIYSLLPDRNDEEISITRGGVPVATLVAEASDPILGKRGAPIALFVFSDFECDHCADSVPILKTLVAKHDNVRVVWKDAPFSLFPTSPLPAHIAARCAQQQGKFWEYHDKLFETQGTHSDALFQQIAAELELNEQKFSACMSDKKLELLVQKNVDLAESLAIDGTPYFVIDTERFSGTRTLEFFEQAITRAAL